MKLDVIGKSKIWFALSGVLIIASIVAVFVYGLNWGIDFTGGSLLDVTFEQEVNNDQIKQVLNNVNVNGLVQASGDSYLIKMSPLSQDEHDMVIGALRDNLGELQENRFDSIGPVIGQELKDKSIEAIVLLLVLIVLYVAWAFRKVSEPVSSWKYGLLTIVAAMHDIIIPIGAFAVLGYFYGYEIDTAFVAALLTILGYSINDTIVIFDRTRENLISSRHSDEEFASIVNRSVVQSFARSVNTSFTTLLVLLAIFFFGGKTTQPFVLALIIGIVSGTYSSIFLASPLLVWWEKK